MKPKFFILLFTISLTACSEDPIIENTTGTKLLSIEYINDDRSWTEQYSYGPENELSKIEELRSDGKRYEMEYQGSILTGYKIYQVSDGNLIIRDSIVYNSNGTIHAIYSFRGNSILTLSTIFEYDYDHENRVSKFAIFNIEKQKYFRMENYTWHGNNIEKVAHFTDKNELFYEAFYEFDDKINYNKGVPKHLTEPIYWNQNNVTQVSYKDYIGLLDVACQTCVMEYEYNLDDYPVNIKFILGNELKLEYE